MAKVFLSHAAFDSDLAMCLKSALEASVEGLEIFCSSDPTDLPPGTRWPQAIQQSLQESEVLLLLATARSLSRPWVWFECGTFWFGKKKIIPLCIGQVRKNSLPSPLSELTALNVDESSDFASLIQSLAQQAATARKAIDPKSLVEILKAREQKIEQQESLKNEGWIGVAWEGKFLSYDGPIEGLKLIEDRPFQQSMSESLAAAGFRVRLGHHDRLTHHADFGYRIVYLTDRKSWRQKITRQDMVLIAKPPDG